MEKNTKSAQDFYNQEAQTYKKMYEPGYEYYPANLIRLKLIIKRLKENNSKKILDAGCGTAIPMIKLLISIIFIFNTLIEVENEKNSNTKMNQKGQCHKWFIHLDTIDRRALWSY